MPKGLISNLLREMESRGRDSTGIAFRLNDKNRSYRLDESASTFVRDNEKILSDSRRSIRGIAHTRRASPGLPICSKTAHPHPFWKYFFAHNGMVKNWKDIRKCLQDHYENELKQATEANNTEAIKAAQWCFEWSKNITTDSQVLGPYIDMRNFSSMIGSIALTWLVRDEVYAFHFAKEAVACQVLWKYVEGDDTEDHLLTVVNSTKEIIEKAFEKVPGIEYHIAWLDFPEGRVFKLTESSFVDEGAVPTGKAEFDKWSSAKVDPDVVIVDEEPTDEEEPENAD